MRAHPLFDADAPRPGSGGPRVGDTRPAGSAPAARSRQASVVLREEGESAAAMMDPANRSLADALKITFRLLQLAMVVLFALFAFSGLQTVKEGESGLRLVFGDLAEDDMAPGMRFALPAPIGEIVRVPTGNEELEDASGFYPMVSAEIRAQGPDRLPYNSKLNPSRDGSILTGDQAVAHIIMRVQYRRTDPASYARNVLDDATEDMLVLSASRRGIVRACAEISIDNLLREQNTGAVARHALEVAQQTLDQTQCGITIERINLVQRIPPAFLRAPFNKVQIARTDSDRIVTEARTTADQTLNSMAGLASDHLVGLIDEYDRAMDQRAILREGGAIPEGDRLDPDAILAQIDAMLEGRPVTIGGETVANLTSGEATRILQRAAVDRVRMVNSRQASLQMFLAKLEQFNQNPEYMLAREWTSSLGVLMARDYTQKYVAPALGGLRQLVINQDPNIIRELDAAQKRIEAEQAAAERTENFLNQNFATPTGTFSRPE